jgi:hypothetical protein
VNLGRTIPEWREIPADELDRMVEFLIRHYPEIPTQLSLDEIRETMRRESEGSQ